MLCEPENRALDPFGAKPDSRERRNGACGHPLSVMKPEDQQVTVLACTRRALDNELVDLVEQDLLLHVFMGIVRRYICLKIGIGGELLYLSTAPLLREGCPEMIMGKINRDRL